MPNEERQPYQRYLTLKRLGKPPNPEAINYIVWKWKLPTGRFKENNIGAVEKVLPTIVDYIEGTEKEKEIIIKTLTGLKKHNLIKFLIDKNKKFTPKKLLQDFMKKHKEDLDYFELEYPVLVNAKSS